MRPLNERDSSVRRDGRRKGTPWRALLTALILLWSSPVISPSGLAAERPKVRAVTVFIRLDRARYQAQISEALDMLRNAKTEFELAGYEVQTIRITTQPFPEYIRGISQQAAVDFFKEYDKLASKEGFSAAIGPAMLRDADDQGEAELLGEIMLATNRLDASLVVAGEDGVHEKAISAAARLIKLLEERTPHSQGSFRFAAIAMVPPNTPFYPGSFHLGAGHEFAVALQSANVVAEAFSGLHAPAAARRALEAALGKQALAIESVARRLEKATGWKYVGLDLSPAPLKEVSIGEAVEKFTGTKFGSSGTMTAAALITSALHAIPVKRAGYSGLMLPVLEDSLLARRWSEGVLKLDALLAYSAVCGTGLDVVPLPGDTSTDQLERIITDMASLAVKLRKPLSARLLPVAGKKAGDQTEFTDPFLVNATITQLP